MNKFDVHGIITIYKVRFIAKGYSRDERIVNDEAYVPLIHLEVIHILLAFLCRLNFKLDQIDIKFGFLNKIINEEVYVSHPHNFEDDENSDYILKLKRALFDLKQVPRVWCEHLSRFLLKKELTLGTADTSL